MYEVCETGIVQEVSPVPLSRSQFMAMRVLYSLGALTMGDVAKQLNVSRPATSKLVDRLVRAGLVSRESVLTDRRSSLVSLTEDGKRVVEAYYRNRREKQARILESFSPAEREGLFEAIRRYIQKCIAFEKNLEVICLQCDGSLSTDCLIKEQVGNCVFRMHNQEMTQ